MRQGLSSPNRLRWYLEARTLRTGNHFKVLLLNIYQQVSTQSKLWQILH